MTIGVLDSGIGGVAVMKRLLPLSPQTHYIYYSDNLYAPYGSLNEQILTARVTEVAKYLVSCGAEAILLLCNTATTVALNDLKKSLSVPVCGVQPDLSGASDRTLVLSTMLTAKQILKRPDGSGRASVVGLRSLSSEIEAAAPDFSRLTDYLTALLTPYRGVKQVFLACTHYIHLAPLVASLLPEAEIRTGVEPLIDAVLTIAKKDRPDKDRADFDAGSDPRSTVEFLFSGEDKGALYRAVLAGR